jgi:rhamnulokinase
MTAARVLAFDLGAESGRAVAASFDGERLALEEVHRFPNEPVRVFEGGRERLYWNALGLLAEVKRGIALASRGGPLASLGIDTWGVDFGLLDGAGCLLGMPYHYRDHRTTGMLAEASARVGREAIFEQTGVQLLELNSLYQLLALQRESPEQLEAARTFLMMPDLLHYWLTGRTAAELTNATTSQCYDPRARDWARALLGALNLPVGIFPPAVSPGTVLERLLTTVGDEVGAGGVPVIAVATHDTGSAVAGAPLSDRCLWISSGTWSIVGVEVPEPVISPRALALGFGNEGGVEGTFRLCRNVAGLWLIQECRRSFARGGERLSYDDLTALAAEGESAGAYLDLRSPDFLAPPDMPEAIRAHCAQAGQPVPADRGQILRCALESLALAYREVMEQAESLLSRRLDVVHVFGGGSRNWLLNQLTADATGRPVFAGPAEATSLGNALVQLTALGYVESIATGRELIRRSFALQRFEPTPGSAERWAAAAETIRRVRGAESRRPVPDRQGGTPAWGPV